MNYSVNGSQIYDSGPVDTEKNRFRQNVLPFLQRLARKQAFTVFKMKGGVVAADGGNSKNLFKINKHPAGIRIDENTVIWFKRTCYGETGALI